jgi:hypothetical protein
MRRAALCGILGLLLIADLFGAVLLAATVELTLGHGGMQWAIAVGVALLCGPAFALTWQLARRLWPGFPRRFLRLT